MYAGHTHGVIGIRRIQVAMHEGYEIPGDGEKRPAHKKAQRKHQYIIAPLEIDERGEYVGHVATSTFVNVRARYVNVAIFEKQSLLGQFFGRVAASERAGAFDAERAQRQRAFNRPVARRDVVAVIAHDAHRLRALGHRLVQHLDSERMRRRGRLDHGPMRQRRRTTRRQTGIRRRERRIQVEI